MHEFWKNSRFTYNLNSISRVTILKGEHALTNPQIQWVTFSSRVPCVATKVRFSPATVVPIPWSAPEQSARLPPIMITEPLRFQPHQKPTSSAPCKSLPHEVCPKPSVVWYCPPCGTLHFPRHKPLDQTEPFLKSPLLVILERNVFPLRQFPVVPNRGVCPESSLRVILISLPPTSQNAGDIMSALYEGSAVSPAGWILLYHQSPESSIQCHCLKTERWESRPDPLIPCHNTPGNELRIPCKVVFQLSMRKEFF